MLQLLKCFALMVLLLEFGLCAWGAGAFKVSADGIAELGEYQAKGSVEYEFTVQNLSTKPIRLLRIRSTCGCLKSSIAESKLAAGGSSVVSVSVDLEQLSGEFIKTLYLETDLPQERFIRLELRGTAIPLMTISPEPMLYLERKKLTVENRVTFEVALLEPVDLEVLVQTPELADVTLEWLDDAHLNARLEVRLLSPEEADIDVAFQVVPNSESGWKPVPFILRIRATSDQGDAV